MAKLIFVPDWLRDNLEESGKSVINCMADKCVNSSILSKYDVINYFKSQIQFLKYMYGKPFSSVNEMEHAYMQMMWHALPQMPEVAIYMNEVYSSPVDFSLLVCDNLIISDTKYSVVLSEDNKIAYIIGGSVNSNPLNALPPTRVNSSRMSLAGAVLDKSYSGFRVITDVTDRSSVFRENYLLTQLYVKSLCNV